ncbi:unnamed protein product [Brassica rapa]|uniref:Uncharacterized protein n=1 Tax=Brassica campestris TaxID=3711 RepID=A0A3P5ZFR9_BRACM|nr:unnamed protein product [Brassica rapa]VDC75075.1 unnamed protein product [Brassica rapa]
MAASLSVYRRRKLEEHASLNHTRKLFDTAFRLFHGHDDVVSRALRQPLQENIVSPCAGGEKPKFSSPAFYPLAAKAATTNLSSFGHGGPFGFDALSDMFKNQEKKSDSSKKKDSSSKVKLLMLFLLNMFLCTLFKEHEIKTHQERL